MSNDDSIDQEQCTPCGLGEVKTKKKKKTTAQLLMNLDIVSNKVEELMNLTEGKNTKMDGWEKITAVVDSGAARSVMPKEMLTHLAVRETSESRGGECFKAAGGAEIPNLGVKKVTAVTQEGHKRVMEWVVCPVRRPLISVAKVVEAGNDVYLGSRSPRIVNTKTGQCTYLRKQGGVYVLDLWVHVDKEGKAGGKMKNDVFAGQK